MTTPSDRRYAESHEWFQLEGDIVTIGLTQFAVDELTDITYVEMKSIGTELPAGESVGEVESVKTTSDIYSVVAGEVTAVNDALEQDPSLVNNDPYGAGWLVKVRTSDPAPLEALMDQAAYDAKHPVG